MTTSMFHVTDMHCASCEARISHALKAVPGIHAVRTNPTRRELFVEHDNNKVPVLDLFGRLEQLGFTPMLEAENDMASQRKDIKRLGIAAIGMMQVVMQAIALYVGDVQNMAYEHVRLFQLASFVITLPVIFYSAQPFFFNAWSSIIQIRLPRDLLAGLSMDVPVSLALILAFSASTFTIIRGFGDVYFDSVVMFTFLLLTARLISNGLSRKSAGVSILSLLPERCTVVREASDVEIDVSALVVGDRVLVRPGERIVADGVVVEGTAHVDESLLTGEAHTVVRLAGDVVTAGTSNSFQSFEFRVQATPSESRLATIERLTKTAMSRRNGLPDKASRIASYFVCTMLLVATCTAGYWIFHDSAQALSATISVLVVSCPCALALATPAAITAALSRLQGFGVVVRDGDVLRLASDVTTIAVDKTGTLTTGRINVSQFEPLGKWSKAECFKLGAGLERSSNHPIARAFHGIDATTMQQVRIDPYGVTGECEAGLVRIGTLEYCSPRADAPATTSVKRSVWLSVNEQLAARFELEEELRSDAHSTLEAFNLEGLELVLLSGDQATNCSDFSDYLPVHSDLTPEAKRELVAQFKADSIAGKANILMLGDGINDLPALAEADVSAVVLEAPDVVQSRSNVLLLSRQLRPIYELILTARKAMLIIKQNMSWAVGYNITMIPLAASGYLAPWMAALGMSLSSILVVANSARLQSREL
ncbi:MAG: heavy metal translocating P-type ATPase [Gammaproteobacteria bacterium]